MTKSYDQYCAIARALDVVGERWSLLLVRELLAGPKRYTDLADGLPGIAPAVLSTRLRALVDGGVITSCAGGYALTPLGAGLEPVLLGLSRWGLALLGTPREEDLMRMRWYLDLMRVTYSRTAAAGVHDVYEFTIDGETAHVIVSDGTLAVHDGPAAGDVDLRVCCSLDTFVGLATRAVAAGAADAVIEGEPSAVTRCLAILAPPPSVSVAHSLDTNLTRRSSQLARGQSLAPPIPSVSGPGVPQTAADVLHALLETKDTSSASRLGECPKRTRCGRQPPSATIRHRAKEDR